MSAPKPQRDEKAINASLFDATYAAAAEAGGIVFWTLCPATGVLRCSDTLFRLLGEGAGEQVGSVDDLLGLMHEQDGEAFDQAVRQLADDDVGEVQCDFRLRDAKDVWRWFKAIGTRVSLEGQDRSVLLCGTITEVTDRKAVETLVEAEARAADEHRERLHQLAENSQVGLFESRILADGIPTFEYVSDGFLDLIGVSRAEVDQNSRACLRNVLPEDLVPMQKAIEVSRKSLTPLRFRCRLNHPERGLVWLQSISHPSRMEDGSTTWHGSAHDVTLEVEREAQIQSTRDQALRMQKQMEELALHDVLTGLPNRRYFDTRLKQLGEGAGEKGGAAEVTLIRVDLDQFKYVNDNLGHDAGDAVLKHVASILKGSVRTTDFVARVGGDEFSIILGAGAGTRIAQQIIQSVQTALKEPFLYGKKICRFGASFGIATCDVTSIAAGEIHAFADAALYEAKQKGRNRSEVFNRRLHDKILANRRLTNDIEAALERGDFEPVFQPQICARTRALVGLETLARWRHPERGLLSPADFMQVAEQIRVVPLIDIIMLRKTRDILAKWRRSGFTPAKISFNVRSSSLNDAEILQAARHILDDGTAVAFEMSESVLMEDDKADFNFSFDALKDSGIQIEIDNFGSGKASVIAVMEAEPDAVKIDRRLSCNVSENPKTRELLVALVRLSAALGISTTVEGVETQEQASILTDLGYDVLQGYLFSGPLDDEQVLSYGSCQQSNSA